MLRILKLFLVLLLLPPLIWLSIIVLNVHLPLSILNTPLSVAASYALGRNVNFGGELTLAPTLVPTLEITRVSVGNPEGREGQLLTLGRVYLELDLVSLLMRDIVVKEFLAQEVRLTLEIDENDVENWRLNPPADLAADEEGDTEVPVGEDSGWDITADIHHVTFEDISLNYRDAVRGTEALFEMEQLEGRMRWREDIQLSGSGSYQHQPWQLEVKAGAIRDLVRRTPGWQMEIEAALSGLLFEWQLELLEDGRKTQIGISGANLASLAPVAGVGLPEWGPYEVSGVLTHASDAHALRDFRVRVGESIMSGSLDLRMREEVPHIEVDLRSEHLQLDDFRLATVTDASAEPDGEEEPEGEEESEGPAESESEPVDIEALLSPEVLGGFRLKVALAFDEILAGADRLGGGYLRGSAGGDRVTLEEWHVDLDAGDIDLAGAAVATGSGFDLAVKLDIENFDYGVVARRADPESDLKGQFFLKVDLQSSTPHLAEAMAHGNGGLDFAVWPEEFRSGVIDLWAVGLLSAALNQFESESVVNCVVARFDLEQGVMRERALLMDTSEIRVLGDAVIDFPNETVDVFMKPRAKKRQFISAATPVQLKGGFKDFEPKIKTSDITFSVVRSGFNIALLGIPLLFQKTLDADGSEDCRRAMVEDFRLERKRSN
jgi:uncharacterized protein involved in outer membrane biogenesis